MLGKKKILRNGMTIHVRCAELFIKLRVETPIVFLLEAAVAVERRLAVVGHGFLAD